MENDPLEELKIVAPRIGAWIETRKAVDENNVFYVAPRIGAWIETEKGSIATPWTPVAPRIGAWIETEGELKKAKGEGSPLA